MCAINISITFKSLGFLGSTDKESICNAGDPGLIPGSGRSPGEGIGYPLPIFWGFPGGSAGKELTCHAGNLGLIPELGRSPWEGNNYPLQYSGLENSTDCIVHGVAKSWTQLSNFHIHKFAPALLICYFWRFLFVIRTQQVWLTLLAKFKYTIEYCLLQTVCCTEEL